MPIIGHEKIISFFDNLIAKNNLAQSYCFVGSDGVGKKTVARSLAAKILKINEKQLDTHPDFYYISRQIDEKTEKLKKDISIIQARQIKTKLGNKSWFGGYQIVIIDEAELLNEESGNALLKTLEESGQQRVFFLLTSNDGELLSTIRSRCQMFYFSLVDAKLIEVGLESLGYNQDLVAEAAKLSWGRPGRAVALASDDILLSSFKKETERWQKLISQPYYKKIEAVEDLFNEKLDNLRTSEKLSNVLEIWTVVWREKMLEQIKNNSHQDSALLAMAKLVDSFKKAQELLAHNINPRLIIEQILLNFN